ncbi:MAG: metal-dependent hydrolase [Phycisphaerae bacterium]|nr:metal-dependent hydrolase [Phycisphaerae bacterium]
MDSLTHALIGAVVAQLGLRQRIGRETTWVMAGAAMLADLDTLAAPLMNLTGVEVDDLTRITVHRGLSHSLLAAPVIALPVAALWWWSRRRWAQTRRAGSDAVTRRRPFALLYVAALLAAVCHPLLDWCTSYGTQLFAPISHARLSLDAIPIVDVFFTPLLAVTVLACFLVREIRRGVAARATLAIGWTGFALAVGYIAVGRVMHDVAVQRALAVAGSSPVRSANAYPSVGSIFLWRGVVRTDAGWQITRQNLWFPPPAQPTVAGQDENEWVARANGLEEAKTWQWFAQGQVRSVYHHRDGLHIVELHDMRYGLAMGDVQSLWALRVTFDQADPASPRVERVMNFRGISFGRLVRRAWGELWRR